MRSGALPCQLGVSRSHCTAVDDTRVAKTFEMVMYRVCLVVSLACFFGPSLSQKVPIQIHEDKLGPVATRLKQRLMERLPGRQLPSRREICYDMVGCFDVPGRKRSLKKSPQSPGTVDTKFWLYTRNSTKGVIPLPVERVVGLRDVSQLLRYDDSGESLRRSDFDPSKPIKVLIHGFKGSGKDKGALFGVQAFLQLEDVNVVAVDWEKGAADSYPTAAANTELIGRQTALMLMEMIDAGAKPGLIHVIGFSLGAHIAGCAGNMVQNKGHMLSRITGLDPASPLFKHQLFRESSTKLDSSDAEFVDVVHTDGSPIFTDGFGLLSPIGHVDFFPNGGREQPGCSDGRGSVVVSTLEGTINSSVACSHVRAWQLFLESSLNLLREDGCQFIGYPCVGDSKQFGEGRCFPEEPLDRCLPGNPQCNVMGMGAYKNGARGVLYLSTRAESPFCGDQLQAVVRIAHNTEPTRGYLHMQLTHGLNYTTNFRFTDELSDGITGGASRSALSVAVRNSLPPAPSTLKAVLSFQSLEFQSGRPNVEVYIDELLVSDRRGRIWRSCKSAGRLVYFPDSSFSILPVDLNSVC